jgi:hypothetical protein
MGFALRSRPPARFPPVTERNDPLTVCPVVLPTAEAASRPDRLRFLGFAPDRSFPRRHVGLAQPPEDTPLGFSLPGFFTKALARLSPNLLSRASPRHPQMPPPAPQSLDRPLLRSSTSPPTFRASPTPAWSSLGQATLLGFLHRLVPGHSSESPSGL